MEKQSIAYMTQEAVGLLKRIISIPSVTFGEENVAQFLQDYLTEQAAQCGNMPDGSASDGHAFDVMRIANNIAAIPSNYNTKFPTLMVNAHCDTVAPAESYTLPPYEAIEKDGAIYGLGSNDDGGSLVCLIQTFMLMQCPGMNIILLISAEEERSGEQGIAYALKELEQNGITVDFAIIGEPTGMRAAVAERGLLVLDCTAEGVSGHAARNEGTNAIYKALEDIEKLRNYKFGKRSPLMGDVKLSATQINAGSAHNVVPDRCSFVVDIRPTEQYTNSEIVELLQKEVTSVLKPRKLTNRSSATPAEHPLIKTAQKCGLETFVSPTTSDWMKIGIPAIKMGPGDSARSHKADEYIKTEELRNGIATYIDFITALQYEV